VAFASPSAVRNLVSFFAEGEAARLLGRTRLAAIGPTTAAALREAGLPADAVAADASGASLAQALRAALAR